MSKIKKLSKKYFSLKLKNFFKVRKENKMDKSHVLAAVAGMCGSMGAVSGKLAFDWDLEQYARCSCVAVFIGSNIVMWATYTRALALSDCTSTPMIINMACNFALTGILGSLIFSESHSYLWWLLLIMLITGLTMLLSSKHEDLKEE
ncbi:Transmembrane protein 42 [Caenorhabditis elegans]|uniref:Transmembrane protein 42 n=1 Tax=Caenorhabditis elegans TaxID=6239 RepID=Q20231_CAEEL|nr:Transmembrane protein 42 [Caenorhabditis elegans]CAA93265.2 Transmembrane protein 42 [Caenorhabditis elegans]|eukprot:NP_496387.2 Uncharacterized protein CELE_F40F8.3 [Caenorhabditis elegans]